MCVDKIHRRGRISSWKYRRARVYDRNSEAWPGIKDEKRIRGTAQDRASVKAGLKIAGKAVSIVRLAAAAFLETASSITNRNDRNESAKRFSTGWKIGAALPSAGKPIDFQKFIRPWSAACFPSFRRISEARLMQSRRIGNGNLHSIPRDSLRFLTLSIFCPENWDGRVSRLGWNAEIFFT